MILTQSSAARQFAAANNTVTISKNKYDDARTNLLKNRPTLSTSPWPPTSQTVAKRLGNGKWADALRHIGLEPDSRGRRPGLLVFSEENYKIALRDYFTQMAALESKPTFGGYEEWVQSESRAGRRRPSGPSVRLLFQGWNAKRAATEHAPSKLQSTQVRQLQMTSIAGTTLRRLEEGNEQFITALDATLRDQKSHKVSGYISSVCRQYEYAYRNWFRAMIDLDADSPARRLAAGRLQNMSGEQKQALQTSPPDLSLVLSDGYIDKVLGSDKGDPRKTDRWFRPDVQNMIDQIMPADALCVRALRQSRNLIEHLSTEAEEKVGLAFRELSQEDERFLSKRAFSETLLLDWLGAKSALRLKRLLAGLEASWSAMATAEDLLRVPAS